MSQQICRVWCCVWFAQLFFSGFAWAAKAVHPNRPIIFMIPGAGSSGDRIHIPGLNFVAPVMGGNRYFGKFQKGLQKGGYQARVCPLTRDKNTRLIEERVEECVQQILESRGKESCEEGSRRDVVLLGHSMGGLVGRMVAQDARVKNCVYSLTTVATPHVGTPMADFTIEHIRQNDIWGFFAKLIGFSPEKARYLPQLRMDRTGYPEELFSGCFQ
jgi:triacylglycerol esterase/lipase EstA (alpha/beta hydrolase family)